MTWLFSAPMMELYASSRYSPEQAAESSPERSSAGAASAPLSVMPTPHPFWRNGKPIDFCRRSPFGQTCARLTEAHGEAVLTSFLADFPARISASPAKAPDSMASSPDCGWKWRESFARFDRASPGLKTRQRSLLEGSTEYSQTLPRWGWMRAGELSALPPLVPTTSENASGFLPTPTRSDGPGGPGNGTRQGGLNLRTAVMLPTAQARDHRSGTAARYKGSQSQGGRRSNLNDAVARMIPTPTAGDAKASGSRNTADSKAHFGVSLTDWIRRDGGAGRMLPSPQFNDFKSGTGHDHGEKTQTPQLRHLSGGLLNPEFHCWMMGWPERWTSLEPMANEESDPTLFRVDRIKCSGNGQVPRCAAVAWRLMVGSVMLDGRKGKHESNPI